MNEESVSFEFEESVARQLMETLQLEATKHDFKITIGTPTVKLEVNSDNSASLKITVPFK